MGETLEGGAAGNGTARDVNLGKPCSSVASKQLDGGAESSTCGICSAVVQTRGRLDCCSHLFCFSCITEWFTVSNLCPLCKTRSRFITPQMFSTETGLWEKLESESAFASRDGMPNVEHGQAVSFPPDFIDEEAVLCLEGDRCLVRAGMLDLDAEGNAAADTSVACDLCDCWYHGGCVGFKPDQTSFVCPRCLASREADKVAAAEAALPTVVSWQQSTTSTTTSSRPETQAVRGDQIVFGGTSMAVEEPEEGESHVSISLRRFPDTQLVKPHRNLETKPSTHSAEQEIMWSPIREPLPVRSYGTGWPAGLEPFTGVKPLNKRFPPPKLEPVKKIPFFQEEVWSPTRESAATTPPRFEDQLWSPTPETSREWSPAGVQLKPTAGSAHGLEAGNPQRRESRVTVNTNGARQVAFPRTETLSRSFSAISSKTATAAEATGRSPNLSATRSTAFPPGLVKEGIAIDVDRLQLAVEQLRKGKRKALQEDGRNIDVRDLPEMPRKIARKSERKIDAAAVKAPVSTKDFNKTTRNQVPEKRTLEAVNSVTKRRIVDLTSLAVGNGEKRMGGDVFPSKEKRTMIADVGRRKNTKDQVSEKRIEVAVNSPMKGGSVDLSAPATDNGENRIGPDVLLPKDKSAMTADVVTRSEDQKQTVADVSASIEEQKRPVADVISNMEEEKTMVASATVEMEEQKETIAHITSQIEGQKKTVVDVTTAKPEEQKTHLITEKLIIFPMPESSGDVTIKAEPTEFEAPTSTPQPEPLDVRTRTEAIEVEKQISTHQPASLENGPKSETTEVDQHISILQPESSGDAAVKAEMPEVEQQINFPPPETLGDTSLKAESTEISCQAESSSLEEPSVPGKVEVTNPERGSEVDLMDIVRESRSVTNTAGGSPSPSKGVRTRIIMHREQDMNDSSRPSLVERIRQQMRETAGYGAVEDLGKVDVSDDRFIAAFKAAQARSNEKCSDTKPGSSKAESSGRLWKVLDKKYSANGARDNLIRKLYAGGGRKCWDRDWDIAFWRERDPNQRKARKEGEEGKNSVVKEAESDPEDAEFFDRLYIADTSLFPRNEDVKPLSVQGNKAEGASATEPERDGVRKVTPRQLDKGSKAAGVKDDSSKSVDSLQSLVVKNPKAPAVAAEKPLSASAKAAKLQGTVSAADKQQGEDAGASAGTSDVKKDKRQWALEILARKEGRLSGSSSAAKTGGAASGSKDNPFELLLQLPVEMRPLLLGDTRRNKIPLGARQVQLNRLVEQELKRANLAVIGHNVESIEAVARAVAREEELCKSSNSKGVYLNRCVRALASTEYEVKVPETTATPADQETEEPPTAEVDEVVRKAFEDTGLVDSPTSEPVADHDGPDKEDPEVCGSAPQNPVQKSWPENVLEVENTDMNIGSEISLSPDTDLSGDLAKGNSEKKSAGVSAVSSISSGGQDKPGALTVVLKASSRQNEAASGQEEGKRLMENVVPKLLEDVNPLCRVGGPEVSTDPSEGGGCAPGVEASYDDADDVYDGLELNLNPVVSSEVMAQLNAEPDPLFPERQTRENEEDPGTVSYQRFDSVKRAENGGLSTSDTAPFDSAGDDDCLKFADIDRRIENIRRSKALNGDSARSKKPKGRAHGDANRTSVTSVQMQVEIYVNQHLKPLYRSQVITAEQFKWTVTKTAAKVMEHHQNALNADFLITEGSKVKKLADQYLRAFAQRKA